MTTTDIGQRFTLEEVRKSVQCFQGLYDKLNEDWETESKKYEHVEVFEMNGKTQTLPVRNYSNERGELQDPSLFPYHQSCYPLLDAYDSDNREEEHDDDNDDSSRDQQIAGSMPCSHKALHTVFYGPTSMLPTDINEKSTLLLKLLKHALSSLQKDYVLVSEILLCLKEDNMLRDVSILRSLLVVLLSEYDTSVWHDDEEDVVNMELERSAITETYRDLARILGSALDSASDEYTLALYSFVFFIFQREYGHLTDVTDRSNNMVRLKRNIVALRNWNEEVGELDRLPFLLVGAIVQGLVRRIRCFHPVLTKESDPISEVHLASFASCLRCLVSITEATIVAVPPGSWFAEERGLCLMVYVELFCGILRDEEGVFRFVDGAEPKPGYYPLAHHQILSLRLSNPFRYSDRIDQRIMQHEHETSLQPSIRKLLVEIFHTDLRDLAYVCFQHDYVMPKDLNFGYGDFLVWCGFEIVPHPLLAYHSAAYPLKDAYESDSDDESNASDGSFYDWDFDIFGADRARLSQDQMGMIHNFSLLSLEVSWRRKWSPATHSSFQLSYRRAAKSVALCIQCLSLPSEITQCVIEFLPRTWWPDERLPCMNEECEKAKVLTRIEMSVHGVGSSEELQLSTIHCPHCSACYCSKGCWKSDKQHLVRCWNRETRIPAEVMEAYITAVRRVWRERKYVPLVQLIQGGGEIVDDPETSGIDESDWEDDDGEVSDEDDEDWSSIDTTEEEQIARLSPYLRTIQEGGEFLSGYK